MIKLDIKIKDRDDKDIMVVDLVNYVKDMEWNSQLCAEVTIDYDFLNKTIPIDKTKNDTGVQIYLHDSDSEVSTLNLENIAKLVTANVDIGFVYFIFDDNKLIYIGSTKTLRERIKSHLYCLNLGTSSSIKKMSDYFLSNLISGDTKKVTVKAIEVNIQHYQIVEFLLLKNKNGIFQYLLNGRDN